MMEFTQKRQVQQGKRQTLKDSFRTKRFETSKGMEDGLKSWEINRKRDDDREAEHLSFELSMQERRRVKKEIERQTLSSEFQDGVAAFDRNMKRLGINGDDTGVKLKSIQGTGLDHFKKLESQVEEIDFAPEKNKEMMKKLNARRTAQVYAHKEKERRRRKVLVDQQSTKIEAMAKKEQVDLLQGLLDRGRVLRANSYKKWIDMKQKELQKADRLQQVRQNETLMASTIGQAMSKSLVDLKQLSEHRKDFVEQRLQEARVEERKKKAFLEYKHKEMCAETVEKILSLVFCVIQLREETMQRPMMPKVYRNLKHIFKSRAPLPDTTMTACEQNKVTSVSRLVGEKMLFEERTGTGIFAAYPSSESEDEIDAVVRSIATQHEPLIEFHWPKPKHFLCICVLEKANGEEIATQLSNSFKLQVITVQGVIESTVSLYTQSKEGTLKVEEKLLSLGDKLKPLMDKGSIIPDTLTAEVIATHVQLSKVSDQTSGCIIKNYPRTLSDLQHLEQALQDTEEKKVILQSAISDTLEESDQEQLESSIDWIFCATSDSEKILQHQLADWQAPELSEEVENPQEMIEQARTEFETTIRKSLEEWDTNVSSVSNWCKKFGNYRTIDLEHDNIPFAFENIHLLVDLVSSDRKSIHDLNRRDQPKLVDSLQELRIERRKNLPRAMRIWHEKSTGERTIDSIWFSNTLSTRSHSSYLLSSTCSTLYGSIQDYLINISTRYQQLFIEFESILYEPKEQQKLIQEAISKINRLRNSNQIQNVLNDLQVYLGDVSERNRSNASSHLTVVLESTDDPTNIEQVIPACLDLLCQIAATETTAWLENRRFLKSYFNAIEPCGYSSSDMSLFQERFDVLQEYTTPVNITQLRNIANDACTVFLATISEAVETVQPDPYHNHEYLRRMLDSEDRKYLDIQLRIVNWGETLSKTIRERHHQCIEKIEGIIGHYLQEDEVSISKLIADLSEEVVAKRNSQRLAAPLWISYTKTCSKASNKPRLAQLNWSQLQTLVSCICQGGVGLSQVISDFPAGWAEQIEAFRTKMNRLTLMQSVLYLSGAISEIPSLEQIKLLKEQLMLKYEQNKTCTPRIGQDPPADLFRLSKSDFFSVSWWKPVKNELKEIYFQLCCDADGMLDCYTLLLTLASSPPLQTGFEQQNLVPNLALGFGRAFYLLSGDISRVIDQHKLQKLLSVLDVSLDKTQLDYNSACQKISSTKKDTFTINFNQSD